MELLFILLFCWNSPTQICTIDILQKYKVNLLWVHLNTYQDYPTF